MLFAPTIACRLIIAPLSSALALGDFGYFVLVMTTFGLTQHSSSRVVYSGINARECILTPLPMVTWCPLCLHCKRRHVFVGYLSAAYQTEPDLSASYAAHIFSRLIAWT